jgi:CDP-glucose 4,6-dehydratase
MRALVTGGTGFLGSNIVKRLSKDYEKVVIITTDIRQKTSFKTSNIDAKNVDLVKGDIRDFDFLRMLFSEYEFDVVFHLAAFSEVRKCQNDAKLAFDVNVGGTINILEACRLYGNVKAIAVSSSDKAYGRGKLPYKENDSLDGKGVYEVSKSATDLIARSYYDNYNLPVFVTRCSNLYGGNDMNFSRVIPNTIRLILSGKSPVVWKGSEKSIREFLYVDDAVDAYLSLIENIDITKGNSYNIGSGEKITIGELVNLIKDKLDKSVKIVYKEKNFPEISHQYLDSSRIKKDISWSSKIDFKLGIEKTIKKYKEVLK